jgi:hypothetical protein
MLIDLLEKLCVPKIHNQPKSQVHSAQPSRSTSCTCVVPSGICLINLFENTRDSGHHNLTHSPRAFQKISDSNAQWFPLHTWLTLGKQRSLDGKLRYKSAYAPQRFAILLYSRFCGAHYVKSQMNRSLAYPLSAFVVLAACFGTYRLGLSVGATHAKEAFGPALASVQADLGLTKLQRLRVLEADLARGCSKEALAKLRFDVESQLVVLASFYREHKGTWVIDELVKRGPTISSQLEGFKNQYGSSLAEPKCSI